LQQEQLTTYLQRQQHISEEEALWHPLRMQLNCYLIQELPPLELVTSVRCIVFQEEQVLVVKNPFNVHIQPGGRREQGESLEESLRRELLEETGWEIQQPSLLGVKHFHHITPRPENYQHPYPDFLQLVYCARATLYRPEAKEVDGFELGADFLPVAEVKQLTLTANERIFLETALQTLGICD